MYKLRDYQREAVDSITTYFRTGKTRPLLIEPTGAGKSLMIAFFIKETIEKYPHVRIICLTHVKELIQQNFDKLMEISPMADAGIYSAGLRRRDTSNRVIFGGIQSVVKQIDKFGPRDAVIVDECHLINPKNDNSAYQLALTRLRIQRPKMVIIGCTATPFRLGYGLIYGKEDSMFDGIAHETKIETLIDQGHLVPPVARFTDIAADMTNVGINSIGDYKEGEMADEFRKIMDEAVDDIIARTKNRKCTLIFCSGVEHAKEVHAKLSNAAYIDGTTPKSEREELISDIRSGKYKYVVNIGVLTTGFDAPIIDAIAMLRATQSETLYIQIIGRGLRIMKGKTDCLYLDYGGNLAQHGPVNIVEVIDSDGKGGMKTCPECDTIVPSATCYCPGYIEEPRAKCTYVWMRDCAACEGEYPIKYGRTCSLCGYDHEKAEREQKELAKRAHEAEMIERLTREGWEDVTYIEWEARTSAAGNKMLMIKASVRGSKKDATLCLIFNHHSRFVVNKAINALRMFKVDYVPGWTPADYVAKHGPFPPNTPVSIKIKKDGKYKNIVGVEFTDRFLKEPVDVLVDF